MSYARHYVHWRDVFTPGTTSRDSRWVKSACGISTWWKGDRTVDPEEVTCGRCRATRLFKDVPR